jgi:hypothetical protein
MRKDSREAGTAGGWKRGEMVTGMEAEGVGWDVMSRSSLQGGGLDRMEGTAKGCACSSLEAMCTWMEEARAGAGGQAGGGAAPLSAEGAKGSSGRWSALQVMVSSGSPSRAEMARESI